MRRIGFLQGPSSLFFDLLGDALTERGAGVVRMCFCLGDRLYWRRKPAIWVRAPLREWRTRLERLIESERLTDLVMLGDGRPRHEIAIAAASALGVTPHVLELGYRRPGWITHEIGGVGPTSPLRADALDHAPPGPPPAPPRFHRSFAAYAAMDVAYNLANIATSWALFPHYHGHSTYHPLVEYAGWARKLAWRRARARRSAQTLDALRATAAPFFLFALQLENDFQLRKHGLGRPQIDGLRDVMTSFRTHAPPDNALLVKAHPMDNTWIPWRRELRAAAASLGLDGRVWFIETGALAPLLREAQGIVTVNSGAGFEALAEGTPVAALGRALYDRPGLTHQGSLSSFWRAPPTPDPGKVRALFAALHRTALAPGEFDGTGAPFGAAAVADRILAAPAGG